MSSIANFTRQSSRLLPQTAKQMMCISTSTPCSSPSAAQVQADAKPFNIRLTDFQKKFHFKKADPKNSDPFKPWPNSMNPYTGEVGGPTGPEPTRYGDWERRGRCSDF